MREIHIRQYFYLDERGILDIYSQTTEIVETGRTMQKESSHGGRIGANIGISGHIEGVGKNAELVNYEYTVQQRLSSLLAKLEEIGEPTLYVSLRKAINRYGSNSDARLILIKGKFDARQFYAKNTGVMDVNRKGYLHFELQVKPGTTKKSKESTPVKVKMAANIAKLLYLREGKMNPTGHEALIFRGMRGKEIPINVFGTLIKTRSYFQIKPFALWR